VSAEPRGVAQLVEHRSPKPGVAGSSPVAPAAAVLVAALALVACGGTAAAGAPVNCGSLTAGPGALTRGDRGGPSCLLHAYRNHCTVATYRLSMFGVDTIAVDDFRLVLHGGGCRIEVASSFRVVPQPQRSALHGACSRLVARGSDVVAEGCTGGNLPPTVSLTGRR
jgi:hypothetical protein